MGTPKTLSEAIARGLMEYGFLNNEKITKMVELHVKDFLSQKFQAAAMKSSLPDAPHAETMILRLFRRICEKEG